MLGALHGIEGLAKQRSLGGEIEETTILDLIDQGGRLPVDPAFVVVAVANDAVPARNLLEDLEGITENELIGHLGLFGSRGTHRDIRLETNTVFHIYCYFYLQM